MLMVIVAKRMLGNEAWARFSTVPPGYGRGSRQLPAQRGSYEPAYYGGGSAAAGPFALGWAVSAWLLPGSPLVHAFLGATLTATSVGITARVLTDLGAVKTPAARIILGAAVIDDILAMIVLAVAVAISRARSSSSRPGDHAVLANSPSLAPSPVKSNRKVAMPRFVKLISSTFRVNSCLNPDHALNAATFFQALRICALFYLY